MGSVVEEQTNAEVQNEDSIIKEYEDKLDEFLKFRSEEEKSDNATTSKSTLKRKRKPENDVPLNILTDIFLRIVYPISRCMTKGIAVGLVKELGYTPNAILNQGPKMLFFSDAAWDSFLKHLHLIECYLAKNMFGKKTAVRLLECDIEIDILKCRGEHQVRIRDLTKHDDKIQLTPEEFYILSCAASPITRYMKQLVFSNAVVKDYLVDATEQHSDAQILYAPIDTCIFNRIPYEVEMWRCLKEYEQKVNEKRVKKEGEEKVKEEEENNNKEDEDIVQNAENFLTETD